jgi:hypothetical protein
MTAALAFPGGLCELDSFRTDEAPTETTLTPLPFQLFVSAPCTAVFGRRPTCETCNNTGELVWWGGDEGPSYSECSCLRETDHPAPGLCFEDGCMGPPLTACLRKPRDKQTQLRADLEESESLLLHLTQRYPRGRWYHGASTALCEITRAINDLADYGFEDNLPTQVPR